MRVHTGRNIGTIVLASFLVYWALTGELPR